ncbi:MAG: adenylate/guanylate cyclase domain-containing protein [Hyphomonadaceae bacterium]
MSLAADFAELWARPFATPLKSALGDLTRPKRAPPRIAMAIAEAERISEILVGWVQLAGVATFAFLYLASRGAFDLSMGIEPVPLALLAYGAFVIWRLRQAYRGALPRTLLTLSAVADVSVLMLTIWGFTLQYGLPAALYLKAPTLLYVFILIALRALRFDPFHLILTGALAALGWASLVAIAAFEGAPVTADYRIYMTSLSLLWGAEAEKIAAILAVTAVLALAVARARALLVRTATEEIAAADLARFLDGAAAKRVRGAERALMAGDGELRNAAILFLDLRGFSKAAAQLDAKGVIALVNDYHRRFVPLIEAAGGSVDKFMGDGILVSFGAGNARGREAADALDLVPGLLQAADAWRAEREAQNLPPLEIAIAITAGEIVYGVVGHDDRLEFTAIGDAVNLAAKLEKHAKLERARAIMTLSALARARMQGATAMPVRVSVQAIVDGVREPVDLAILA